MGIDVLTLSKSKKYTDLVALGLASATVDDVNKSIIFTLASDGSQHTIHFSQPSDGNDGISVTGISDKGNGKFTLLLSDGSETDPIQTVSANDTYTGILGELKSDLGDLDSRLSESITEIEYFAGNPYLGWEVGGYKTDGVTPTVNQKRLRSIKLLDITNLFDISSINGIEFSTYVFDADKSILGNITWKSLLTKQNILTNFASARYLHFVLRHGSADMTVYDSEYLSVKIYDSLAQRVSNLETKEKPSLPAGFINPTVGTLINFDNSFDHSNPINIYKTASFFTTDFDIKTMKKPGNTVVYISPNGDDLGDGTKDNPFKTINKCIESGASTIHFEDGIYYLLTNFAQSQRISREVNMLADNEAFIYFAGITNDKILPTANMYIDASCYVENMTFVGGNGLTVSSGENICAFNHCKFTKSTKNGLNHIGKGIYLYECEATDNMLDGFNYHKSGDINPTGVVEIRCKSFRNGNVSNRSSNGSTIHDHGRIIRLGCEYGLCHGGVLADSTSKSYNFDILSHTSTNQNAGEEMYNSNYDALSGSEIWLYNCMGGGSRYELCLTSNSIIHTDTSISSDKIYNDGTGTIDVISNQ